MHPDLITPDPKPPKYERPTFPLNGHLRSIREATSIRQVLTEYRCACRQTGSRGTGGPDDYEINELSKAAQSRIQALCEIEFMKGLGPVVKLERRENGDILETRILSPDHVMYANFDYIFHNSKTQG